MKMESEKKVVIHHHHPPAKKQRIAEHYECNICSASFENVQKLRDHFLTQQEENNEDEEESPD